ncbi:MAG TPA: DUF3108 domain-containing protein, partial [Nannocystis exedens]|nr:DUF3108 domain-containing protein [Nannocystis exedens]
MTVRRIEPASGHRESRWGFGGALALALGVFLSLVPVPSQGAPPVGDPSAGDPATTGEGGDGPAIHLRPKKGPRSLPSRDATVEPRAESGPKQVAEKNEKKKNEKKKKKKKKKLQLAKRQQMGVAAAIASVDLAKLPRVADPSVVPGYADRFAGISGVLGSATGWSGSVATPAFVDRRRRYPLVPRPEPFGDSLRPGERFRYDVTFSGNPTGIAEVKVGARRADDLGGGDFIELLGYARTSGVVSLLTTLTYKIESSIDAVTGAPIATYAETERTGFGRDRYREVFTTFGGRGFVEIHDKRTSDKKKTEVRIRRRLPIDTLDSLAVMAWVRALNLKAGERARVYGLDGKVLLRVDITGQGPTKLDPMPGIGTALGLATDDVYELSGTITRVDRYGAPIPGKKVYKLRVWVSDDERRIPVA